jgi:hypothetical protein
LALPQSCASLSDQEISADDMRDAILAKLRAALTDPIDSECKAVYILAESRKLLDSRLNDSEFFALKLYCHWALHVDLTLPNTTLPFLQRAENYVARFLDGNRDAVEEHTMLKEFALDTFRDQFKHFLAAYGLPTVVCDDGERWHEFITHYAGVIEDGSLSCTSGARRLELISRVEFKKGKNVQDYYLPFGLLWTIVLRDGRKLGVEVKTSAPKGHELLVWSVTLP